MGEPTDGSTNTIVTKAGQRRVLDWYNTALRDAEGRVASVLAIGHDVTDRVAAEQRIRASLEEKEVLVKEIHHRVKNNMQVVSSLLRVQRRNMKGLADQCVLDAFTETESRIKSMALAHERLYCSQDLTDVDLAAYIPQVAGELLDTYDVPPGAVTLETRVEPVRININQGIPCGLIVNELVSNALKYAFPGGRKGRITLGFRRLHDGVHELSVHDDGVGLPEGFSPQEARTMGMAIVNALTGQLGGELSVVRGGGTCFRIRFPVGRKTAGG
jgi:two-component sensor histidine kinase